MAAGDDGGLRLPFAGEFSPGQVELVRLLELVDEHEGDEDALVEAIRAEYFAEAAAKRHDPAERLGQQRQRARNVLIGMRAYELLERKATKLTDLGRDLANKSPDESLAGFARHILRDLPGLDLLEAVRALQARHESVGKRSLAAELRSMGYDLPRATTHHTVMLAWLRTAGVLEGGAISEERVAELAGISLGDRAEWALLSSPQRALLRVLKLQAEHSGTDFSSAKVLVDTAVEMHGALFPEDQLRAKVFRPLADAGWIELSQTSGGRGAKSGSIAPTQKLLELDLRVVGPDLSMGIPPDLRTKLNTPLDEIFVGLDAADKHTRGIALELLAVRLSTALGLTPVQFRARGAETGGAEVDLVAEGAHLQFSRWLFQCKNVPGKVHLSALAKEVGMAVLLRGHVVVLVTTGTFATSVVSFAAEVARTGPLQIVLLDGEVLSKHRARGATALLEYFHDQAAMTMQLKRPQIAHE